MRGSLNQTAKAKNHRMQQTGCGGAMPSQPVSLHPLFRALLTRRAAETSAPTGAYHLFPCALLTRSLLPVPCLTP